MPEHLHIVQEGEWLTSIAHRYGFPTAKEIYDYEKNEGLREIRKDPDSIGAGDEVWIPPCPYEVELKMESAGGGSFSITAQLPEKEKIEMIVRDEQNEAFKNEAYALKIGGYKKEGTTDGDGKLTEEFDARLMKYSNYEIQIGGRSLKLGIGHLDPVYSIKGVQARLNNMGYSAGEVDGNLGEKTRQAIRTFQADQGLKVDGQMSPQFLKKLEEVYK